MLSSLLMTLGLSAQSDQLDVRDTSPAKDDIGPNHKVVSSDASGGQVVLMATGMHYWDGTDWVPSEPTFEVTESGFQAMRMQARVRLSANLNTPNAVTVITRDGVVLNSTPVGIGLYDAESGQSTIIASIQNCEGTLIGDSWVLYENAFNGVCADVIYKIDQATFEQDVVIIGRLNPEDWGFPAKTTRIQIFTEFYGVPEPESIRRPLRVEHDRNVRDRMATPDLVDEVLGFGEFVIGTGRAATLSSIADRDALTAPVTKEFREVNGRTLLIESLEYPSVAEEFEALSECVQETASIQKPTRKGKVAELELPIPSRTEQAGAIAKPRTSGIAKADVSKRPAVVIDYVATIGGTLSSATVFAGDVTYFLTNAVTCNGAVTIEGGAVFKFPTNSTSYLKIASTLACKTSSYRPAIFTAGDDDTVGDKITTNIWSSYTGTIRTNGYGNPALWISALNNHSLSNLSFRYSQEAVRFEGTGAAGTLIHSKLAWCIRGVVINGSGSGSGIGDTITLDNNLMANVQLPLSINNNGCTVRVSHTTADTATRLITSSVSSATASFTNSVFANIPTLSSGTVTVSGKNNGFYNGISFGSPQFSAGSSPFQAVGAGYYYLTSGSSFRNAGLTGISSTLSALLKKRTTYPPIILTNAITVATTLSPQAQRDTDSPDLGYHYDPLDYAVNSLPVTSTLILTNGVALATYGNNGIWLQDGGQLYSEGTPINHNHLARFFNVQEQPTNWGGGTLTNMISINPYNNAVSPPSAQIRFTDFDAMAASGYHIYTVSTNWTFSSLLIMDSSVSSASFFLSGPGSSSLVLTNNLFERVAGSLKDAPQIRLFNNLYRYGSLTTTNTSGNSNNWVLKDNAFDSVSLTNGSTLLTAAYNAYIAMGTTRFTPTNANDKVLTNFLYTLGPLGGFYHNTNVLANAGSQNATNAGMFHYTTTTNLVSSLQVKETNSIVDIGFHYVAVDSAGIPIDTDGDGRPDYFEDRNGDGNGANDATAWQTYNSPNGLTGNPGLQVFTPLK